MGSTKWTSGELKTLRSYISTTENPRASEIATILGRSADSVQLKANRMGLKFRGFTDSEISEIRRCYESWDGITVRLSDLATRLGVRRSTISMVGRRLGLTRKDRPKPYLRGLQPKKWSTEMKHLDSYRGRARKLYDLPERCQRCKKRKAIDRHHKDGMPRNNSPGNIAFLCRRCHMEIDGRLSRMAEIGAIGRKSQGK